MIRIEGITIERLSELCCSHCDMIVDGACADRQTYDVDLKEGILKAYSSDSTITIDVRGHTVILSSNEYVKVELS